MLGGFTVLLMLISGTAFAGAQSFRSGNNVTTPSNKKINETLFAAGRTVNIDSEVFGDVFCAGQNITVSGAVHGDVVCAGQTVNVSGTVDGDVRLAGQNVTLGAKVAGNATITTQSFVLESTGKIGGDASIAGTDTTLNGEVGRDLAVGGSQVTVSSLVGRNVQASANNLTLSSSAKVNGNIALTSHNNIHKDSGAVVSGKITRTEPKEQPSKSKHGAIFGFGLAWFLYCFLAMLATAMVLVLLFPRLFQGVTDQAMPRPWMALLTGVAASILVPVLGVIIAITIIGIPLAMLLALVWLVICFLSGPAFAYYIGRLILRRSTHALLIMLVGAAVLLVLYFIPILGILAILAAFWIGTGMLVLELFNRTPSPAYNVANERDKQPKPASRGRT